MENSNLEGGRPASVVADRRASLGLASVFAGIALLAGADLASDMATGTTVRHTLLEGAVVAIGMIGFVAMVRRVLALARRSEALLADNRSLNAAVRAREAEAARWREQAKSLMEGLGAAIDAQFDRWSLSPAEKEVALLLLKGLSHKEVATARGVGEATARQQARAVYKKAGLSGRHDLAAFFLEDLLLPAAG